MRATCIIVAAIATLVCMSAAQTTPVPLPATIETCGGATHTYSEPCLKTKCTTTGQFFDMQVTGTKAGNAYGYINYTTTTVLSKAAVHMGIIAVGVTRTLRFTCNGPQTYFEGRSKNGFFSLASSSGDGTFTTQSFTISDPFTAPTPAPTSVADCDFPHNVTADGPQLSARKINDMLYLTNLARRTVVPTPMEMELVSWDADMAARAKTQAEKCQPSKHMTWEERNNQFGFWAIGENIGGGQGSEYDFDTGYLAPFWQWINEAQFWGPYPAHDAHATSGHYNMMIYAETTKIGCGYAHCPSISNYQHVWICLLGEGGNYPNTASYLVDANRPTMKCHKQCDSSIIPGGPNQTPDLLPRMYTPTTLPCPQAPTPTPQNWCGSGACAHKKCTSIGQTMDFTVQGSYAGNIWGTDIYSDDSVLGEMAIHMGLLKDGETKYLRVTCHGSSSSFTGTLRNTVQSQHWTQLVTWTISLGLPPTPAPTPAPATPAPPTPTPLSTPTPQGTSPTPVPTPAPPTPAPTPAPPTPAPTPAPPTPAPTPAPPTPPPTPLPPGQTLAPTPAPTPTTPTPTTPLPAGATFPPATPVPPTPAPTPVPASPVTDRFQASFTIGGTAFGTLLNDPTQKANLTASLQSDIAKAANVNAADVVILDLKLGSLVVNFEVKTGTNPTEQSRLSTVVSSTIGANANWLASTATAYKQVSTETLSVTGAAVVAMQRVPFTTMVASVWSNTNWSATEAAKASTKALISADIADKVEGLVAGNVIVTTAVNTVHRTFETLASTCPSGYKCVTLGLAIDATTAQLAQQQRDALQTTGAFFLERVTAAYGFNLQYVEVGATPVQRSTTPKCGAGCVVGIVFGVTIGLVVIAVLAIVCYKRKGAEEAPKKVDETEPNRV